MRPCRSALAGLESELVMQIRTRNRLRELMRPARDQHANIRQSMSHSESTRQWWRNHPATGEPSSPTNCVVAASSGLRPRDAGKCVIRCPCSPAPAFESSPTLVTGGPSLDTGNLPGATGGHNRRNSVQVSAQRSFACVEGVRATKKNFIHRGVAAVSMSCGHLPQKRPPLAFLGSSG